jgi:hypothetical protein
MLHRRRLQSFYLPEKSAVARQAVPDCDAETIGSSREQASTLGCTLEPSSVLAIEL